MVVASLIVLLLTAPAGVSKPDWTDHARLPQLAQAGHSHSGSAGHSQTGSHESQTKKADTVNKPSGSLRPAEGASVKILSPKAGQSFKGDQVPLQFKLVKGKKGHHVHAYVDGELMGMFESDKGTLTGIKPGKHVLELRVVADDHQTELDAKDAVRFTVQ
jgi:hypothetical protein